MYLKFLFEICLIYLTISMIFAQGQMNLLREIASIFEITKHLQKYIFLIFLSPI